MTSSPYRTPVGCDSTKRVRVTTATFYSDRGILGTRKFESNENTGDTSYDSFIRAMKSWKEHGFARVDGPANASIVDGEVVFVPIEKISTIKVTNSTETVPCP